MSASFPVESAPRERNTMAPHRWLAAIFRSHAPCIISRIPRTISRGTRVREPRDGSGATRDNCERTGLLRNPSAKAPNEVRFRACAARRRVGDGTPSVRSRREPARSGRPGSGAAASRVPGTSHEELYRRNGRFVSVKWPAT